MISADRPWIFAKADDEYGPFHVVVHVAIPGVESTPRRSKWKGEFNRSLQQLADGTTLREAVRGPRGARAIRASCGDVHSFRRTRTRGVRHCAGTGRCP